MECREGLSSGTNGGGEQHSALEPAVQAGSPLARLAFPTAAGHPATSCPQQEKVVPGEKREGIGQLETQEGSCGEQV